MTFKLYKNMALLIICIRKFQVASKLQMEDDHRWN